MSKWSEAEEDLLIEEFEKSAANNRPLRLLTDLLPNRTYEAIRTKLRDLRGEGKVKPYQDYNSSFEPVVRIAPPVRETNLIIAESDDEFKYFLPIGDIHSGAPNIDLDKVIGYRDWALDHGAWILLMGDLVEYATRRSVGAGVYEQISPPQEQIDQQTEIWRPAAEEGLILGALTGNHEERAWKDSNYDATRDICGRLGIPYLRYSGFLKLKVQDENYIVFATHGSSGARLPQTKMKNVFDLALYNDADLYLMGHVHELMSATKMYFNVNTRNKTVEELRRHFVLTGHFLGYQGSYADMKNMQPSKTGAPRIRLAGDKKDIHVSI